MKYHGTDLVLDERGRLICQCCNLPFAYLKDGCLVVQSVHGGEKHINAVALDTLVRAAQGHPEGVAAKLST